MYPYRPAIKIFSGLLLLCWAKLASAELVYMGVAMGPAQSTAERQFDLTYGASLWIGFQMKYYMTYELAVSKFSTRNVPEENEDEVLTHISGTAMGHLPIGDSSLFARAGLSIYQYQNSAKDYGTATVPTIGTGFDLAIKPKISLRLEWQRYFGIEYRQTKFDIDNTRLGFIIYF